MGAIKIEELSCEHVQTEPRDVDWRREWETSDGGDTPDETFTEAQRCEGCGMILVFAGGYSGGKHGDAMHETIGFDWGSAAADTKCDGYVGACEGPAMNYAYPCDWTDAEETARALVNLPVIPVVDSNGHHALALTGGGMDLSWEICEAYIALGFLPPLHYAKDLPLMAGLTLDARRKRILDACERTARISVRWAENAVKGISDTRKALRAQGRKRSRAAKGRR